MSTYLLVHSASFLSAQQLQPAKQQVVDSAVRSIGAVTEGPMSLVFMIDPHACKFLDCLLVISTARL